MSLTSQRLLPPMERLFIPAEEIPSVEVTRIEGQPLDEPWTLQLLMVTPDMHCIKVQRPQGSIDPAHVHEDHTTICCLVFGKLQLTIGGARFLAEPGDTWVYRQGVQHHSEALEHSLVVEIKAPACRTW